jgi:hypothetical protein
MVGDTSLNEDQPGRMAPSSKLSMNASARLFARTRVPAPAHTPLVGTPVPPLELLEVPELLEELLELVELELLELLVLLIPEVLEVPELLELVAPPEELDEVVEVAPASSALPVSPLEVPEVDEDEDEDEAVSPDEEVGKPPPEVLLDSPPFALPLDDDVVVVAVESPAPLVVPPLAHAAIIEGPRSNTEAMALEIRSRIVVLLIYRRNEECQR